MHEPVRERPVVREQERARRVPVEPADRDDPVLVRDELHDRRTALRIVRGRDDARGLVQQDVGQRLEPHSLAVHLDDVAALDEGREPCGLAVHGHAPGLDQLVGPAARGNACAG